MSRLLRIRLFFLAQLFRDEGTSYHYAPANDEISYNEALLLTMEKALDQAGIGRKFI